MKDKIEQIIQRTLFPPPGDVLYRTSVDRRIEAAAEAIATLMNDKMQAMATLTFQMNEHYFSVPDGRGATYTVLDAAGGFRCSGTAALCKNDRCNHIKAVKLYLAMKENKQ